MNLDIGNANHDTVYVRDIDAIPKHAAGGPYVAHIKLSGLRLLNNCLSECAVNGVARVFKGELHYALPLSLATHDHFTNSTVTIGSLKFAMVYDDSHGVWSLRIVDKLHLAYSILRFTKDGIYRVEGISDHLGLALDEHHRLQVKRSLYDIS